MRDAASGPFRVGSRSYLCLYMLLMEVYIIVSHAAIIIKQLGTLSTLTLTLTLTHHH